MEKIIKIILDYSDTLLKKKFNTKNKVLIKFSKKKSNSDDYQCIVTLEQLDNKYFYCTKCKAKYSYDGLEYWSVSNSKCSSPWCSNSLDNLCFCVKLIDFDDTLDRYNIDDKNINLLISTTHFVEHIKNNPTAQILQFTNLIHVGIL